MGITGIGRVHLNVSNLERAVYFYQEALGMLVLAQEGSQTHLGTADGSVLLVLHKVNNPPPRKITTGLYHFALLLPQREDLARLLYHLVNNNVDVDGVGDHGVSEAVYLSGPDGVGIELAFDRPQEDWPYDEEDFLDMGTEELDLDNLMMTLKNKEKKFTGLPNGTKIGHIHLAVKELEQSAQFYSQLGLDLTQEYGEEALFFAGENYHHHVGMNTWKTAGAAPLPPDTAGLRFFELCYDSPEVINAVTQTLQAANYPLEPTEEGSLATDPSGIKILLKA